MNLVNEISRKALHLLLILIPMSYNYLGKWQFLTILAPITIVILALDYARCKNAKAKIIFTKIFSTILREHELQGDKLCGASWVFLGACINFAIFKPEIAITGFTILVISDALAALVGKSVTSQPFFEKSFAGSLSFFVSAIIILFVCGNIYDAKFWFYFFGFFAVFCVTMIEARPSLFKLDDNIAIPLFFSGIMTFFDIIWNYTY